MALLPGALSFPHLVGRFKEDSFPSPTRVRRYWSLLFFHSEFLRLDVSALEEECQVVSIPLHRSSPLCSQSAT